MSPRQRVMVGGNRLPGAIDPGGTATRSTPAGAEPVEKKGTSRLVVLGGLVIALLVAAVAYLLFVMPASAQAGEGHTVEPGELVPVDPVSLNLAGGHYLRLGFALQLTEDAGSGEELSTAPALDLAIALFSGRDITEVDDPAERNQLKTEFARQLTESYHGEVVDVYFTQYVTQ